MCSTSDRKAGGNCGQAAQFLAYHADSDMDVAQQLALIGIREAAFVVQLVDLADIVQDHAGEQQIGVDEAVVLRRHAGHGAHRKHVLQQAAQERMVNVLGGRRAAVAAGDILVIQHRFQQSFEMKRWTCRPQCRAIPATSRPDRAATKGK